MDRLFRKRTVQTKEAHGLPLRSTSFNNSGELIWPDKASSSTLRKKKKGKDDENGANAQRENSQNMRDAPRVELNIRNSLMLPGLSQRFSVLLPSLSSIPANSLRDELASQRQRGGGPAITEEEEELLFAELNDIEAYKNNYALSPLSDSSEWDGRPPTTSGEQRRGDKTDSRGYMDGYYSPDNSSPMTTSISTPNLLGSSSSRSFDNPSSASLSSSPPISSPPPTSTSFDSFATFGVGGSGSGSPVDERNSIRTKSYGFSGGSGMRDNDYIRKMKKSASGRNISGTASVRSDDSEERGITPSLPKISIDQANAYKRNNGEISPTGSDRTATPTSGYISPQAVVSNGLGKRNHSPSSSISLGLNSPLHPPPTAALPPPPPDSLDMGRPQKHRKSMLQGLTPAQMRRISAALVEIGNGRGLNPGNKGKEGVTGDEEETLETDSPVDPSLSDSRPSIERQRYDSNPKSDQSGHSTGSSVFPYHVSPTTSSFATAIPSSSEPTSPPTRVIPPSPKSRDLAAQVERPPTPPSPIPFKPTHGRSNSIITEAARPVPILTPTKSKPVRHTSSLSTDSSSPIASSIPRYIPGQPRPIGSSVKSDAGSDASRSGTPINPSAYRSPLADSNGGRNRSDSNPSPVKQPPVVNSRSTSLARSRSVQQNGSPSAGLSPPLSAPADQSGGKRGIPPSLSQPIWRRPSSPLVTGSNQSISEAEEEDPIAVPDETEEEVRIRPVTSLRSVAHSRSDSNGSSIPTSPGPRPDISREPSQQGYILSQPHQLSRVLSNDGYTARNGSSSSIGSSYKGSVNGMGDRDDQEVEDRQGDEKILRELSGLGREEFMEMQIRLVDRAKAEREALLGGMAERSFSPVPQVTASRSFPMDLRAKSPTPPLSAFRALSPGPILAYRATTPDITESRPIPTSPITLGNILTPPPATTRVIPSLADHRAPPPPPPVAPQPDSSPSLDTPSETHSTSTQSHSHSGVSRRASQGHPNQKPSTPGDDPEKVRDYEARIAAATAALNRTPTSSAGASKLERKPTKKTNNATMVISTPRLLSSSVNLSTKKMESSSPEIDGTGKALENASGSGKKMSLRWRKLGFGKKGPSISSSEGIITSPPLPSSASPNLPTGTKLQGPIALAAQPIPPPMTDNQMQGFKFPPPTSASERPIMNPSSSTTSLGRSAAVGVSSPPGTANPTSGLRQMMDRFKKGKSDEAENTEFFPPPSAPLARAEEEIATRHTTTGNEDTATRLAETGSDDPATAMAKFIAAGKAVGLNDGQLNEMLLANGMLKKSGTSGTSPSSNLNTSGQTIVSPPLAGPQIPTAAETPIPPPNIVSTVSTSKPPEIKEEKEKGGGIFRSLSRKKSKKGLTETARKPEEVESRNKIVRRTLLLPDGIPITPQPNRSPNTQSSPLVKLDSPTTISFGRKPSTRRKPIPVTSEEQMLGVDGRVRNASLTGGPETKEESGTAGLGFLSPSKTQGMGDRTSSASRDGSLYDLYGDMSHDEGRIASDGAGNKGIEIMEYEDGRVVWGVIDALRDDDAEPSDSEYTQAGGTHSRKTSYASSTMGSEVREASPANGWKGSVAPLQLRHRERGPAQIRPETNLYFTSPTDIGDLIDQLSQDPSGNKGRIDFLPPSPGIPQFSSTHPATPPMLSAPGQFEDAPSPGRKPAPSPIVVSRTNNIPAGGFSPKRQKHVRQGGFGRPGAGSLGGGVGNSPTSAASFTSSQSGVGPAGGKPVEDRLQALMDRLVSSGATRKV